MDNKSGLSMLNIAVADSRPIKLRSRVTNDPSRLLGVDMRTCAGRRFRDIVGALVSEFGAVNPVALRELAGLKFSLEATQAAVINGDSRAREDLVRISNLVARRERELRIAKRDKPKSLLRALADGAK
jgi:hypothetical protein